MHKINKNLLKGTVKVAVIGAGGTGSQVITGLAQLHAAMIALGHPGGLQVDVIDDDLVSQANVGRQMFWQSDVGLPKAHVLVQRINAAMGLNWQGHAERVTGNSSLNHEIVIGCVDTRKARKAILASMQGYSATYWLDLGNRASDGQVILGEVGNRYKQDFQPRLPNVADLFPEIVDEGLDGEDDVPSCSLADALEKQNLFVNRGVALYGLNLLWELFRHGEIGYHGVFVNLKMGRTTPLLVDPSAWERLGYKCPDLKLVA
jgi:PRTRC genetic system ThiF family protein